ncbi:GmrSD restriction endonuclease domain-containing protein [Bifidobacterium choerinum]|uniref:Type I restriction-modification system DNA methylase n=1 Tax=Bifidobacterium choerinum TaxID=35760 RepID=A0A087AGE5_9BIFI|nr:DUF262 domain-containing protein [Bifidobacterium choerinum]KFI57845.1 Type I restriction-modification system DNA methylase [Bifidobacterium choerinum]
MNIDSTSLALSKILTMESREYYHIPPYQRPYSWKKEQIDQLFQDIYEEASGYYIGNVLVTEHKSKDDASEIVYEVIDGQQRLTTLSLLLLALWEICIERRDDAELPVEDQHIASDLLNDIKRRIIVNRKVSDPRLQLLSDDATIYKELIRAIDSSTSAKKEEPHVKKNRVFVKRYNHILDTLKDAETFPDMQSLSDFYDKLINVMILRITAESIGDAFSIFSSLNSKGLPLTLVDLLKSEFLSMDSNQSDAAQESTLGNDWEKLAKIFTNADGDVDTKAFTQFFLNNYDAFESSARGSITKSKALYRYQDVLKRKQTASRLGGYDYMQEMINRACAYTVIIQLSSKSGESSGNALLDDQEIRQLLQGLKQLESTQAYPLLLFLFVKADELQLDKDQLAEILRAFVTFYVRRNIVEYPKSSNIRSRLIGVIRTIDGTDDALRGEDIVHTLVLALKKMSADDETFGKEILKRPIYDQNAKTTRFVLIDLELGLQQRNHASFSTKARPLDLDDRLDNGKPRWTIEHILPEGKNLPEYWKKQISPNNPSAAGELQTEYMHRFGNLTLTPYNENLQQKPFAVPEHPVSDNDAHYDLSKRDYKDNGEFVGIRLPLQINASIPEEGESIEDKESWTIDDIKRRSEWFRDEMLKRYQFPDVPDAN